MTEETGPIPALAHIKMGSDGEPYIQGLRCRACAAVTTAEPLACPACGAREGFEAFRAAETGKLFAYSIVKRSYPGIETPFVSAIVELDDGVTLKANLVRAGFEPEAIDQNLRVRVRFNDALGRTDKNARAYVGYEFEPVS